MVQLPLPDHHHGCIPLQLCFQDEGCRSAFEDEFQQFLYQKLKVHVEKLERQHNRLLRTHCNGLGDKMAMYRFQHFPAQQK